jgi:hypothetical protein
MIGTRTDKMPNKEQQDSHPSDFFLPTEAPCKFKRCIQPSCSASCLAKIVPVLTFGETYLCDFEVNDGGDDGRDATKRDAESRKYRSYCRKNSR